ncbi:Uncharacterised protein [uncultured archaeon]|nr:Uncharacterised protein [uncultured archaeon]
MDNSTQEIAIVHKIGVGSSGVMWGLINFFSGLVMAIILFIVFLISGSFLSNYTEFVNLNMIYLFLILMPFIMGIVGFISGLLFALFYNLSAKIGKGLKLYSY